MCIAKCLDGPGVPIGADGGKQLAPVAWLQALTRGHAGVPFKDGLRVVNQPAADEQDNHQIAA